MRNLILNTLVTMSLATPALAQNNPVINERNFGGEVYDLSKDVILQDILIKSKTKEISDEMLAYYQSANGVIEVQAYIKIFSEDDVLESGKWYFFKIPSSRVLTCESGMFSNNCIAGVAAIKKFIQEKYVDLNVARGEFLGLDDSGKNLILRNFHSSVLFSDQLPSRSETFEAVYTLSFESCRDEMGRFITLKTEAKPDSIENMIKALRATNFDKIKMCTLTSPNPTWTTENFHVKHFSRPVRMVINSEDSFFASVPFGPYSSDDHKVWFTKQKDKQTDPAKRQQAIHALQVFTKWVKEVYTDHLLNIHYQNLDTLKIGLANEAFFNKNKNQLQDMLNDIQQNFAHLSLMEKIGWLRLLNISFDSIRTVEEQLKTPMNVNLDRVVRSYNN